MSKLLLIDNYDSFTYNLMHFLGELGATLDVVRNDKITLKDIRQQKLDGIVLSPGPCTPNEAGICLTLIKELYQDIPIFGVCLGMQSMGQALGGKVVRAPSLMHGKLSAVLHQNKSVFEGLPSPFMATRYHSLIVEKDTLPDCYDITAQTDDGLIMGLHHKSAPLCGVQFHPESIKTQHGHQLLKNFLKLVSS